MARSYQVSCPPGNKATIADLVTMAGGRYVTIHNSHATEPLYIGGDENEKSGGGGAAAQTLTTSTGHRIPAGGTWSGALNGEEVIWGRSGTSTVTIAATVFRTNAAQ